MAETAAPKLDTGREAQPYAPVSWAAAAAAASAGLLVVLFLIYAVQSFRNHQPLLVDLFCGMPILTVVLVLIAWMHIRNSEGARTGMKMTVVSFWIALIFGLGYFAYRLAIDMAVDIDAEKQFVEWAKDLNELDADNPADPKLYRAFHKTVPPGTRQSVSPDDVAAMERRYGILLAGFRQTDLIAICVRNRGQCKFVPQGLVDWKQTPKTPQEDAKVDCTISVSLECPEGVYGLKVAMRSTTDAAGRREWQLMPAATGLVQTARLTDFGRRVYELRESGSYSAGRFLHYAQDPARQHRGYLLFAKREFTPGAEQEYYNSLPNFGSIALVGSFATVERSTFGYEPDVFNRIFVPVLGADAPKAPEDRKKKEADMRKQFEYIWNAGRMRPTGAYVKDNPDKNPLVLISEKQIEIRYPVEIALPGAETAANTARGRVILQCNNPAVLEEIRRQRAAANPADATDISTPMPNWVPINAPWKLVRIESDLVPAPVAIPQTRPDTSPPFGG